MLFISVSLFFGWEYQVIICNNIFKTQVSIHLLAHIHTLVQRWSCKAATVHQVTSHANSIFGNQWLQLWEQFLGSECCPWTHRLQGLGIEPQTFQSPEAMAAVSTLRTLDTRTSAKLGMGPFSHKQTSWSLTDFKVVSVVRDHACFLVPVYFSKLFFFFSSD